MGNEWRTTDQFQLRPGELSSAFAITAIANHGLFVIGRAADDGSRCHWLVRQSGTGNPGTWSTVDDFQVCAPQAPIDAGEIVPALLQGPQASRPFSTAVGRCVVADESGNIYAGGSVKLSWSAKAVVRKLSLAPQAQLVQSQLDGAQ